MKWNVKITDKTGRAFILSYDGFRTRKEAEAQAELARAIKGFTAEVIKK